MKNFLTLILFTFILSYTNSFAQHRFSQEQWDKFKAEKVSFLTDKLELTSAEAQKFWPVYNQLEKEKWDSQSKRRELEGKLKSAKETLSDKEITKLTRDYAAGLQTEAELSVKYNEDFLKILPPRKVLRLYQAENEFRMHMFNKYRGPGQGGSKDSQKK
jgi:Spy/CpxP family protein refolding chaperone